MGVDKATVEIHGRSMLKIVTAALGEATNRVVVAGRPTSLSGIAGLSDPIAGRIGPLAGLSAALKEAADSHAEAVILVAVDQPFVRPETLRRLIEGYDGAAVVPVAEGVRQVTCSLYPAGWQAEAMAELEAGGSIQSLVDRMPHTEVSPAQWAAWGEDGRSWFSVDDVESLALGIDRYGSGLE